MPTAHPSANPFKNPRLSDAAQKGMLISVRCNLCRRRVNFWASDLVTVFGPDHPLHMPPFPCSRCRSCDYMDVRWSVPAASELPGINVRRPVRQVMKWIWRDASAG